MKLFTGLYKRVTVGPCTEPRPSIFNLKGKSKWTAWMNTSDLSSEDCMQKYVNLVSTAYNWEPSKDSSSRTSEKMSTFGCFVSTLGKPKESEEPDDSINPAFNFVKDGRIAELKEWLSQVIVTTTVISSFNWFWSDFLS